MNEIKSRRLQRTTRDKTTTVCAPTAPLPQSHPQNYLVVGILAGFAASGAPLVNFNGSTASQALSARTLVALDVRDIGQPVALQFELGDLSRPVILGQLRAGLGQDQPVQPEPIAHLVQDILDIAKSEEEVLLVAKRKITLKCGNASITLDADGNIELRGEYILSRSAGQNRIKGSSISLN